jgi:ribosomal protein S18
MYSQSLFALFETEFHKDTTPTPLENNKTRTSGTVSFDFVQTASLIKLFEGELPNNAVILKSKNQISQEFIENILDSLFSHRIISFHETKMLRVVEIKMKPILYSENIALLKAFVSEALTISAREISINVAIPEILRKQNT